MPQNQAAPETDSRDESSRNRSSQGKSAIAIARLCCKQRNFSGERFWAHGYAVSPVGFELEQARQCITLQEPRECPGVHVLPASPESCRKNTATKCQKSAVSAARDVPGRDRPPLIKPPAPLGASDWRGRELASRASNEGRQPIANRAARRRTCPGPTGSPSYRPPSTSSTNRTR